MVSSVTVTHRSSSITRYSLFNSVLIAFFLFISLFLPQSVSALSDNTFISSTSSCSQATYGASANDLMVGFYSDTLNNNTRGYQCFKAGSSNYIGVNNDWLQISNYSVVSGDVIKCTYESGNINFYVNNVLVGSRSDSSLSSGNYIFAYGQDYSNVSSCSAEPTPTATPTAIPTAIPTATPTSYYDFNTMPIPTEDPTVRAIPTDPDKPYLHELCTTNFRPYGSPCTVGQSMFLNPENISSIDQNIYSRVQGGQFSKCQNWRALYSENPLPYNIRISAIQNSVFIKTADGGGAFSSDDFFGSNDGVLRSINYSSSDFYYLYWFRSNYEALNLYPEPTNNEIDEFNDDNSNYLNAIQLINTSTSESRFLGLQQCIYYWDNNATNAITNFPDITTESGSPLDPTKDIKNNPYSAQGICQTNGSMFDISYWFCKFTQLFVPRSDFSHRLSDYFSENSPIFYNGSISGFITNFLFIPITTINEVKNTTCQSLQYPITWFNATIPLPCPRSYLQTFFGDYLILWDIVAGGYLYYYITLNMIKHIISLFDADDQGIKTQDI